MICQALAVNPEPRPCQINKANVKINGDGFSDNRDQKTDKRKPQDRQPFLNGHHDHIGLDVFHAVNAFGSKQLGKLPTHIMNGRDQTNQCGGVGQGGNKKGNDRGIGGKADGETKNTPITHIGDDIVFEVTAVESRLPDIHVI